MAGRLRQRQTKGCPGHPLKWKTPEELQQKIDEYFAACDVKGEPYTICGLALALGTTRETLLEYEKSVSGRRVVYADIVKKAKLRCQHYAELQLFKAKNPAGVIFNLKNNYGWRDTQAFEHTGPDGGALKIIIEKPANYAGE